MTGRNEQGVVARTRNRSIWESEAGSSRRQGQCGPLEAHWKTVCGEPARQQG